MDVFPVTSVSREHPDFPVRLASTDGMPDRLYVRGNIAALSHPRPLAVVGTRKMTSYGRDVVDRLVRPVAARGVSIISGLALGIDAAAHRACLDAGGTTVAVLGSGIDDGTIGPRSNVRLALDILEHGGALVSEYEPGTLANRWTFPARNRIISALSAGVLVIEADVKSGALITARLAADQGRDVLTVPGSILWPRSAGPHMLIKNGAGVVTCPDDILRMFDLSPDDAPTVDERPVSTHNPLQSSIVAILQDGPTTSDALASSLSEQASRIMTELTHLELNGLIERSDDGRYRII